MALAGGAVLVFDEVEQLEAGADKSKVVRRSADDEDLGIVQPFKRMPERLRDNCQSPLYNDER